MSKKSDNHVWVIEKRIFSGRKLKDASKGLWLPTQHLFTDKSEAQEKIIQLYQDGTKDKLRLVKYVAVNGS